MTTIANLSSIKYYEMSRNDYYLLCCLLFVNTQDWSGWWVLVLTMLLIDVEDVKFVINFDYPNNSEDYVHRIGRTGRSQATGTAYTFFTPQNAKQAADLISVLKEAKQIVSPKLLELAENFRGGEYCKGSVYENIM